MDKLKLLKLTSKELPSVDESKYFILITARDEVLEIGAQKYQLPMKIKKKYGGGYHPFKKHLKHIFVQYNCYKPTPKFFNSLHRIRIIKEMIEDEDIGAHICKFFIIGKFKFIFLNSKIKKKSS